MSNDNNEVAEGLMYLVFGLVVIYIVVIITLWIIGITVAVGTTFGSGVSIYNYGLAFKNNVKFEKPIII